MIPFARRQPAAWERPGGLSHVLDLWRADPKIGAQVVLERELPASAAQHRPFPEGLAPRIQEALLARGLTELYTHQREVFEHCRRGDNVVIATPTASGKSLSYNLPVLQAFTEADHARALYLFPTKALSRDQEVSLRTFLEEAGLSHGAITYDGDTPGDARRSARERSGVLITNPDMLHAGILPHHTSWARFFANLRYVVVDELHTYRGVFGSHLANVLRRLSRIAAFHGGKPQFILASATIGNPEAHAERLIGQKARLVSESGAPTGPRHVVVYNPPVVNAELGLRASTTKTAVRLAAELVIAGVPTLVFGGSRNQVEVMLKYLREKVAAADLDPELVQGYRGGYLPEARRRIEHGLREGLVRAVVATNALELGVDIGSIDAVVSAGYPGSIAGTWQRFGRGGRRQGPSLSVLVPSSSPLDQYLARSPEILFERPAESARVDPDNVEILIQHLKCAAFELPFEEGEAFGDVPEATVGEALDFLAQHQVLQPVESASGRKVYHWSTDAYPANAVSLRTVGWDNFVVIDVEKQKTIAEMDWRSTHTMLHEQAIYQHDGAQYQVERLDYDNHKAFVRFVEPDYYTTAMTHTKVQVLHEESETEMGEMLRVGLGDVNVVEKVVGYKKIKFHSHENVGYGEVQLPEIQMPTSSMWMTISAQSIEAQPHPRPVVMDAIVGLSKALRTVAALGLMTDMADIGVTVVDDDEAEEPVSAGDKRFSPTIFLFDRAAGGVGLAPRLYEERRTLLARAASLIRSCVCEEGCPSCVGPVVGDMVVPARTRSVALALLGTLEPAFE